MKGFKTFLFGLLVAGVAVFSSPEMQAIFAAHVPAIGGTVGTLIVILRAVTSSPIFASEQAEVQKKDNTDA